MELKTQVNAEAGKHDIVITRDFDLPVELLFRAYTEPDLVSQWMGTTVLKLENKQHGGYQFETSDPSGNVVLRMNGTIHACIQNEKITRTFEMENTPFPIQLEFLEFESLGRNRSKLQMHIVFRSVEDRDQLLRMPFAKGLNMAHNRLQEIAAKML
jgi:uncharacterized protein YndB with AHSA1/START domain